MKKSIQVGDFAVSVEENLLETTPPQISILAICGDSRARHRITIAHKHTSTGEDFDKECDRMCQLTAEEAAGHERSRLFAKKRFAGDTVPEKL